LEESRELTPSRSAPAKKYDSDIEILSNPSQSSIEVLDETLKLVHVLLKHIVQYSTSGTKIESVIYKKYI